MQYCHYFRLVSFNMLPIIVLLAALVNCNAQNTDTTTILDRALYKPLNLLYIGGYVNASLNYFEVEGETEGTAPTLNHVGVIAQINPFKYFNIYAEFEHNPQYNFQINNLFAQIGSKNIGLRVGYLGFPLGRYKQYHIKKTRYFVEHPLMVTTVLPGISCDAGAGFYANAGDADISNISFEINFVSGLNENIIYTPSANTNMEMGTSKSLKISDNNDNLMVNARLGLLQNNVFEFGASILAGSYTNRMKEDPSMFTKSKKLQIYVFDVALYFNKFSIESEMAINNIELPENITELYASSQQGCFIDLSYELFKKDAFLGKRPLKIFSALRYDYADLNNGYFAITKEKINNDYHKLTLGLSAHLFNKTSIILNGSYQWFSDLLGNPNKKTAGVQLGIGSYF